VETTKQAMWQCSSAQSMATMDAPTPWFYRVRFTTPLAGLRLCTQVFVARRDNARAIFRAYLEQQGGKLQADRCVRRMEMTRRIAF
jgi:hypothetical protein